MIKATIATVLFAAILTGCQAAPLTVSPVADKAPEPSMRRVMSAQGSGSIWGINYGLTQRRGYYKETWYEDWKGKPRKRSREVNYNDYHESMNFSGKGELLKASYDRFYYRVPDDQVLVLNHAEGHGTIVLNGFAFQLDGNIRPIHYVFGPGEEVVIRLIAVGQSTKSSNGSSSWSDTTTYRPMHLSGFTTNPSLLGPLGATTGSAK